MNEQITILIPVYNDWTPLNKLLNELSLSPGNDNSIRVSVLVVDDCSTEKARLSVPSVFSLQILHLNRNIGHQKAIAIGMAYIHEHDTCDKILIMDADGEDRPEDAVRLITASLQNPDQVIFARRESRQEGLIFRLFYSFYKKAFYLLTGKKISFGNFLIMPRQLLIKSVFYSEIWNHIAGGILKAGLPYTYITTHRGKRYAGASKMNFTNLLLHGLGAISVFIEVIASRLLIFSLSLIGISVLVILALIGIRAFTSLAIPGWTSTVVAAMLIVLLQSFLLSLFTIFLYLSSLSQRKFIPAYHYKDYTGTTETL